MWLGIIENSILTLIGFVLLIWGAALLVDGSVNLAKKAGISNLIIGLTLVAFGTSAPELAASLNAALNGIGDIACGNIVGSNIANLGLVMGASAILMPIAIKRNWTCLLYLYQGFGFDRGGGNGHLEGGTLTQTTLNVDLPILAVHQALDDGQTQTIAFHRFRPGLA